MQEPVIRLRLYPATPLNGVNTQSGCLMTIISYRKSTLPKSTKTSHAGMHFHRKTLPQKPTKQVTMHIAMHAQTTHTSHNMQCSILPRTCSYHPYIFPTTPTTMYHAPILNCTPNTSFNTHNHLQSSPKIQQVPLYSYTQSIHTSQNPAPHTTTNPYLHMYRNTTPVKM